jgi:CAAX prenyl protease-like protein
VVEKKDPRQIIGEVLRMERAWKYVVPFGLYIFAADLARLVFTGYEQYHIYIGYALRTFIVGIVLLRSKDRFPELSKKYLSFDILTIFIGIFIFILWVGLEGRYPLFFGSNIHYDPTIFGSTLMMVLIFLRFFGSVLVAPLIEELFMRSFLMRYIIRPNWEDVPIGAYSFESFAIVTLIFGFSHYRWLPGIITAILLNLLLYRKKNIVPCILAHGIANLLLLIYVVNTTSWFFY